MKKAMIVLAATFMFVACNNGASTEATTVDSTVKVDSTTVDSVAAATVTPTAPEVK